VNIYNSSICLVYYLRVHTLILTPSTFLMVCLPCNEWLFNFQYCIDPVQFGYIRRYLAIIHTALFQTFLFTVECLILSGYSKLWNSWIHPWLNYTVHKRNRDLRQMYQQEEKEAAKEGKRQSLSSFKSAVTIYLLEVARDETWNATYWVARRASVGARYFCWRLPQRFACLR